MKRFLKTWLRILGVVAGIAGATYVGFRYFGGVGLLIAGLLAITALLAWIEAR